MTAEPVYIVSGYMRSGTSMMMKVLEHAGMDACYNRTKDRILTEKYDCHGYHPNPEGFFELGRKEFDAPDFPRCYQGRLIKALHWRLVSLPPFRYRVVFMLRDPREIEVSYLKMFRKRPPFVLQRYHDFIREILERLKARNDMDIVTVKHRDMIESPVAVLDRLSCFGFPIKDSKAGCEAVNPGLYRSKSQDIDKVRQSIPGLRVDLPDCLK